MINLKKLIVLCLLYFSVVTNSYAVSINFPGINFFAINSVPGQTFNNAVSIGGSTWDVNVRIMQWQNSFNETIANTNLSGSPFLNPIWPSATGVFFRSTDDNGFVIFDFTFTRTSGTSPLVLVAHNGESVDRERDTLTTTGTDWELLFDQNLSSAAAAGDTVTLEDSEAANTPGIGSWAASTVLTDAVSTITYRYDYLGDDDGANMISFEVGTLDYGDAPDTTSGTAVNNYNTTATDSGAAHIIPLNTSGNSNNPVYLGAVEPDGDPGTLQNMAANADGADEDGWSPPTSITVDPGVTPNYTTSVTVTKDFGPNAFLHGWIDWNQNGIFEPSEKSTGTTTISTNGTDTFNLSFPVPGDLTLQTSFTTYARFRVSNDMTSVDDPTGTALNGEVEDYLVSVITLPVTLSSFNSTRSGNRVDIDWGTSSELFNVGFQLWGLDGVDGQWHKLHNWLVKSGSGNAVEPQSYTKRVRIPTSY